MPMNLLYNLWYAFKKNGETPIYLILGFSEHRVYAHD